MSANLEAQTSTPEEVQEVIAELEQYRQRLIDDTLEMAKKVKMPKQAVMKQLENHPEIVYIDGALANLRSQPKDNTAVETASRQTMSASAD